MGVARSVTIPEAGLKPRLVGVGRNNTGWSAAFLYALILFVCSLHLYRTPTYDMDSIQYMGNALLMEESDVVEVHRRVYAEVRGAIPRTASEDLLGHPPAAPADQT